ncbi:sugar phosphate isomerase/epimerase [Deinococcus sp. S9]|uniref:sugar phosphate isomerase/epimerase family protein n=1 Tax=Deinococcus sp. S9 TaxID=2545754 RepID=UPI0010559E87|nr:sugar phosphate isomerase/epimerase family protein [Deinococcus sp. S9]TDE84756.1 sugar phosphate isomerase/epimerase [Deinococcus sp. S9]
MKFGYQTNTWGGVVGHPAGVTSIKDLFYLTPGSDEEALRDIAAAGYQGVELFDGNLVAYQGREDVFKGYLQAGGLSLIAVYSGANFIYDDVLEDEFWRIEQAARIGQALGAEFLVLGGGAVRASGTREEDYTRLAQNLDRAAELAGRSGLTALYHPHLGTIVEGPEALEKVMAQSRIGLCPDTAHLAAGGNDVPALIRKYASRIPYIHLKGLQRDPLNFLPLDEDPEMAAIWQAMQDIGFDGWVTVELDAHADPQAAAARSLQWLQARQATPAD